MTWLSASLRATLIVLYFMVTTVWLPDLLLQTSFIAEASDSVRDIVVLVAWGTGLVCGLVGLRVAQRRGLI